MAHPPKSEVHVTLLYHFCRLRLPGVALPRAAFERHLARAYGLAQRKGALSWERFLEDLHARAWFLACACLEGRRPGTPCPPPAPAAPRRCSSMPCAPAPCGFSRAIPTTRTRRSASSGATCWPASARARCPFWPATTASARSCPG